MTTFVMNKKTKKKSYNEQKEVKVILIVELKTARHVVSWFTNARLDFAFSGYLPDKFNCKAVSPLSCIHVNVTISHKRCVVKILTKITMRCSRTILKTTNQTCIVLLRCCHTDMDQPVRRGFNTSISVYTLYNCSECGA